MHHPSIIVRNVSKCYKLYDNPIDRLKESLHPWGKPYHHDFHALNNINFEIMRGECVGIIGHNGAGKSTLLKIITGVLTPTYGEVKVDGRIASLLELGAGFNPEYTGIENIYLQGTLSGFSTEEMRKRSDDIITFADIGEFIHQSVKMYSSGMYARLAFAIAIHTDPDVLIVDEALSVGDMKFQQKCFSRMKKLRDQNTTILLVSHDVHTLRSFTSRCIWLEHGSLKMDGITDTITNAYISYMTYEKGTKQTSLSSTPALSVSSDWHVIDSKDYEIQNGAYVEGIRLINTTTQDDLLTTVHLQGNEEVEYSLKVRFERPVDTLMIGIAIVNAKALTIAHLNTMLYEDSSIAIDTGETYQFRFRFSLPNLARGYYSFYTNIVDGNYSMNDSLCMITGVAGFEVLPSDPIRSQLNGIVYLERSHYSAELLN